MVAQNALCELVIRRNPIQRQLCQPFDQLLELAGSHILDHAPTQRTDSGSVAHGSSILSEVDKTSISGRDAQTRQCCPLNWLPVSRFLPPRSGLERSDFVLWHL